MSPASTMLATTSGAMIAATMPAVRRRLVTRDHDQNGTGLHFRPRGGAYFRDAAGGRRQELVLHLHGFERRERRVGVDAVALLHVDSFQEARHRRAQLDTTPAQPDGTAAGAEGALVDDGGADVMAIEVEAQRVVRHHGDLVAGALERDRPLPSADGLA